MGGATYGIGVAGGFFGVLASIFIVQINASIQENSTIQQYTNYVGAQYAAESTINKQLYALKTSDVDVVDKLKELANKQPEKGNYGKINIGASTDYFDLKVNNAPALDIDLGDIVGGDLFFKRVDSSQKFDTLYLNYNKGKSSNILMEIIRFDRYNGSISNCDFYDNMDSICNNGEKVVVNTADSFQNGFIKFGLTTYFRLGTNGFNNQVALQGFNMDRYDYRITFSTLKGDTTNFGYYSTYNGTRVELPNNFIEIDVVGNAINNFARIKLQKNINTNITPNIKYVLFSDSEIAK